MLSAMRRVTVMPARVALPVLVAALLLGAYPGLAGPVPSRSSGIDRDTLRTLAARRALAEDAELAPLNVGVSVRGDVATLWGSVPSPALAARAADVVRRLPQVGELRNTLLIVPREVPPDESGPPEAASERTDASPPGGDLAALPGTRGPAPGQPSSAVMMPADDGPRITLGQPTTAGAAVPRGPLHTAVSLGNPIPHPASDPDLAVAVEQLRRGDARYGQVRAEVRGRLIYLGGGRPDRLDVMAFAQAAARLPGVERVVVEPPPSRRAP